MFGRTGSMVAPQMPLLVNNYTKFKYNHRIANFTIITELYFFQAEIMESLPLILFGTMSVTSGILVLLFPETLNTKLPDTIEEAEVIGRKNASQESL